MKYIYATIPMLIAAQGAFSRDLPEPPAPPPPVPPMVVPGTLPAPVKEDVVVIRRAPHQELVVAQTPPPPPVALPSAGEKSRAQAAVDAEIAAQQRAMTLTAKNRANAAIEGDMAEMYVSAKLGEAGRRNRSVVIRSSEPEAQALASAEEDLNVMSRILEKALDQKSDDRPKPMGIDLFVWSSGGQVRNLFLEDYGALFLLKVRFALAPTLDKDEDQKAETDTTSEWEEARKEVYGRKEFEIDLHRSLKHFGGTRIEPYDEKRVERLQQSLLEALKNATNMRQLKPDDRIMVVVTTDGEAGDNIVTKRIVAGGNHEVRVQTGSGGYGAKSAEESPRGGKVMTIQVRKADVDAFAKDKLSLDEFRRKAKILIY